MKKIKEEQFEKKNLITEFGKKNMKLMGGLRLCRSRDLQRRTGRFLKIKLLIGRKPIWTGSIRDI